MRVQPREEREIEILDAERVNLVLTKLEGHPLYTTSVLALATGMRRGELLALRIGVDLEGASVRVERSLEETARGQLRFKLPKSRHGRRIISLPPSVVAVLRAHWANNQSFG